MVLYFRKSTADKEVTRIMICPKCGHDMGKRAKCFRCGYTVSAIVPIDPKKIEHEPNEERKEINPDDVHVSRAGGSIFDELFGGSIFGSIGGLFGNIFDFFGVNDDRADGYEYDPKYYDDFGNEIYLPDEFERESVEIDASVISEEQEPEKEEAQPEYDTNRSRKHKHKRPWGRH